MAGITYFVALPFDVGDGSVVVGEPIECLSPAAALERAQGLWKILGHTGAVAFSRTGDPATGHFSDAKVIRKFGDVPGDLSAL
jgi:allophanate hydrolase subunit 1